MAFLLEWEGWGKKQHILNENDPQHMKSVLATGLEGRRKDSPQPTWKVSPQLIAQAHIPEEELMLCSSILSAAL